MRDYTAMLIGAALVVVLVFTGYLVYDADRTQKENDMRGDRAIEFEHISGGKPDGAFSGWHRPCYAVLWDEVSWKYIWEIHRRVSPEPLPLPEIDFETQMVIAMFRGDCEFYGYWIEVRRVTVRAGTLTVHYWMNQLKLGGDPTISAPFHIVSIPKSWERIQFVRVRK